MTDAYPLQWPQGRRRTEPGKRMPSKFAPGGLTEESRLIIWEIQRLGGKHAVVSTNIELRKDGLPYSGRRKPEDPGVAVYFLLDGRQKSLACDKWATVEENARAIWKSIEAMRSLERWGGGDFVDAAFAGFDALPAPGAKNWWEILQVDSRASFNEVEVAYKRLAKVRHPDSGGSDAAMAELNAARAAGRKASA